MYLQQRIEANRNQPELNMDQKRRILMKLCQAELLEKFIHTKFFGQKRFSLEGCESLIPALDTIVENCPDYGVKEIVMGMAHRGRLNVLCNTLNKSFEEVFSEFEDNWEPGQIDGNGDVKYHKGYSNHHITSQGRKVYLTLTANPSHLEAVDPVVMGRARAKQRQHQDIEQRKVVLPVLIHGDAAMSGQGLVMEVFQLSQLEGYRVGGTIHIVINNQIGFTTLPHDSRSTRYCTDIAKMVEAPVFHVNADDPEAVARAMELALDYRQKFSADVVIDLVCYRRFGHNETDEPNYTQPTMYNIIAKHPSATSLYKQQLQDRGDLSQEEIDGVDTIMKNQLQDALNTVKTKPVASRRTKFEGVWQGLHNKYEHGVVHTGVSRESIELIGKALSTWPEHFNIHKTIKRLAERRGKMLANNELIDWAFAEMLAFGSLLVEGTPIRLSGQDSRRGTFSQRHSYWYNIETRERYSALNCITDEQAKYCCYNSPLSEAAVLGFDYGYSISEPNMLIIWEAQFGDFANGAQIIIDQFIASSESKWGRVSGLVMMLPHGQEGMGPEHSSARLERFLELAAEDNMQVAYCTTAAQHFHILRRQMHRDFRKPLILMTPKGHLRSKQSSSTLDELVSGHFQECILDLPENTKPSDITRVIACTGKIRHELLEARDESQRDDVAILAVEQLFPLDETLINELLEPLGEIEFVGARKNQRMPVLGASSSLNCVGLLVKTLAYAGRKASASPAAGSASMWRHEQNQLLQQALAEAVPSEVAP